METGSTDRNATYTGGSSDDTLSFNYTVQANDGNLDLDYVAANSLAINTSSISDVGGNNATLTLASPGATNSLGNNKALVVDGADPVITALVDQSVSTTYSYDATVTDNLGIASYSWTDQGATGQVTFGSSILKIQQSAQI